MPLPLDRQLVTKNRARWLEQQAQPSLHNTVLLPDTLGVCTLGVRIQDLSDGLNQRERKVAADRSELDQQRRFQDRQGAHLVRGARHGAVV